MATQHAEPQAPQQINVPSLAEDEKWALWAAQQKALTGGERRELDHWIGYERAEDETLLDAVVRRIILYHGGA